MFLAQTRRVIAAGMIGNVLEWYDFAIYGYFASAIGRQFFPHEDAVAQLLLAFGVFALGFLMRPIGGAFVGHIGDQFGRRAALTFSVAAMAIPTFLIGLLPGYATLGLLAPAALTLLRMVQGLSVGGEYTSSMVFLVERAPEWRRGLMGALIACGATGGVLLGSAVGAGFAASVETLHDHWRIVLGFAGLSVFNAVGFYLSFVYLVSWLQTADGIPPSRALEINSLSMALLVPVVIAAGLLSDRFGRKPLLIIACVLGFSATPVLALEPPLMASGRAWATRLRADHRALYRHIARRLGRSGAAACAVHSGVAGLQYFFGGDRRVDTVRRGVAGRTNGRRDSTGVPDHGIGGHHDRDANAFRETYRAPFAGGSSNAAAAYP
jgi:MFS family permease